MNLWYNTPVFTKETPHRSRRPGLWTQPLREIVSMGSIALSKPCNKCGEVKPLAQFHADKHKKDGRRTICKECRKSYILAEINARKFNDRGERLCTGCGVFKPISEFHKARRGVLGRRPQCSDCRVEYNRGYVSQHAAAVAEYQRNYRQANLVRIKHKSHQWRNNNQSRIRRAKSEYYQLNRPTILSKNRQRWAENSERNLAYARRYRRNNPGVISACANRRRARKKNAEGSYTAKEWEALKRHYGYTCLRCGRCEPEITLTADHVVPLSRGGNNYISNIQPLCLHCNLKKNVRTVDYRLDGGFGTWIQPRLI